MPHCRRIGRCRLNRRRYSERRDSRTRYPNRQSSRSSPACCRSTGEARSSSDQNSRRPHRRLLRPRPHRRWNPRPPPRRQQRCRLRPRPNRQPPPRCRLHYRSRPRRRCQGTVRTAGARRISAAHATGQTAGAGHGATKATDQTAGTRRAAATAKATGQTAGPRRATVGIFTGPTAPRAAAEDQQSQREGAGVAHPTDLPLCCHDLDSTAKGRREDRGT